MGWTIDSPEYAEAYSQWVSSMAELKNRPATFLKNAAEELVKKSDIWDFLYDQASENESNYNDEILE